MKFSKLHGNGNDYVFMEEINTKLPPLADLAVKVSNRNFGIGSDGLIVASPSTKADFKMVMYNADGSKGKMCGNGIRALAKYAYDNGLIRKKDMNIETDAGIKKIHLVYDKKDKNLAYASVDMGRPVLDPEKIPVNIEAEEAFDYALKTEAFEFNINAVSMGNPHSISFLSELSEELRGIFLKSEPTHVNLDFFNHENRLEELNYFDIEDFGKRIQGVELFLEGVNVEIAKVLDKENLAMRVFERGSGETLSCGTGCCAVAVAAIRKSMVQNRVNVHSLGGALEITWDGNLSSPVIMKGPARTVFEGEFFL